MFSKIVKQKIFIHSFVIAFLISFISIVLVFPGIKSLFYTNISWWTINLNTWFIVKVFWALLWQTWVLWWMFYMLAKKIF